MPGLIGKKLGMSNFFASDGTLVPVTIIQAGPCPVVRIINKENDGYEALLLGFGTRKVKNISKPVLGQFKKSGVTPTASIKEFKNFDVNNYKIGDSINVELFTEGEFVKVTGKTKGKGFQGVMRRHNFGGVGGTTHGQSDRLRAPGSIGSSSYPSRVFKGQRMAGRMGYDQVTIRHLKVIKVIAEKNIIMVKGSVPGSINSIVEINK
ncbi:MAG: 50S ribosomal protein L3 [Ignavibacteriales bacterium]|nr:50S ribosomal protein L3 [Ignavibacteriales bacterium]